MFLVLNFSWAPSPCRPWALHGNLQLPGYLFPAIPLETCGDPICTGQDDLPYHTGTILGEGCPTYRQCMFPTEQHLPAAAAWCPPPKSRWAAMPGSVVAGGRGEECHADTWEPLCTPLSETGPAMWCLQGQYFNLSAQG